MYRRQQRVGFRNYRSIRIRIQRRIRSHHLPGRRNPETILPRQLIDTAGIHKLRLAQSKLPVLLLKVLYLRLF